MALVATDRGYHIEHIGTAIIKLVSGDPISNWWDCWTLWINWPHKYPTTDGTSTPSAAEPRALFKILEKR